MAYAAYPYSTCRMSHVFPLFHESRIMNHLRSCPCHCFSTCIWITSRHWPYPLKPLENDFSRTRPSDPSIHHWSEMKMMMSFLMQSLCHFNAVEYVLKLKYICVSWGISSTQRALPFALQKLFSLLARWSTLISWLLARPGTSNGRGITTGWVLSWRSSTGRNRPMVAAMLRCSWDDQLSSCGKQCKLWHPLYKSPGLVN